jgi:hypothetical protein
MGGVRKISHIIKLVWEKYFAGQILSTSGDALYHL